MAAKSENAGKRLPENMDADGDINKDKLICKLDYATIEFIHESDIHIF